MRSGVPAALLTVAAFWAAGCASPPAPPQWIEGAPQGYPEDRYVWAVGAGADAASAASEARSELARKTNGETEGARIAETWTDEEKDRAWALAVLDRAALLAQLDDELANVEEQISEILESCEGAPPEQSLPELIRAIELTPRREDLRGRIERLGGPSPATEPSHERAHLEQRLAATRHRLAIDVEAFEMDSKSGAIGDPLDEVRRELAKKVLELGFRLGQEDDWGDSSSWLRARSRVAFERLELGRRDQLVAVHWEAVLEISDRTAGGETVAIRTEEARATHLNEREARRQAQEDAESFLAAALETWLRDHFTPTP
jgi:hypothetical protein